MSKPEVSARTLRWVREAAGRQVSDYVRCEWFGPRIAKYLDIWEATGVDWATPRQICERAGMDGSCGSADRRQVGRVLIALESVGRLDRKAGPPRRNREWLYRRKSTSYLNLNR